MIIAGDLDVVNEVLRRTFKTCSHIRLKYQPEEVVSPLIHHLLDLKPLKIRKSYIQNEKEVPAYTTPVPKRVV